MSINRKRGSIALARQLCYEIAGAISEDDISGSDYGSVDVAEILSAEVERLREVLAQPEQQAEPCIGKDPRCPCQDGDACHYKDCGSTKALPVAQPEQEPTPWREMVVVSLVREGINKHRARELADHFAAQPAQEPVAYYHPRNGFYWAKPTSIFAPTSVEVEPLPLYTAAERNT